MESLIYPIFSAPNYLHPMKYLKWIFTIFFAAMLASFKPTRQTPSYDDYPVYSGHDLGVAYSPFKTVFKVWAPKASEVKLRLYAAGDGGKALKTVNLAKAGQGTWAVTLKGNQKNKYY